MKGYMLIVEVAISLVLLLSLSSFFYARMLERKEYISSLEEIGGNALDVLEEMGILQKTIYSNNFSSLNKSLRSVLPVSVEYNFFVYNLTSLVGSIINGNPRGITTNVNYFLYGNESYDPRKIELILWYKW